MTSKEQLIREIENSPDLLVDEVLDFLLFTKVRRYQTEPNPELEDLQLHKPIWEFAGDLMKDAPPEALAQLPRDAAKNHDFYLYGAPKVEE
jgi:hypothetical protein